VDGEARQQTDRLSFFEKLTRTPWEFDFFHAMRRIECLFPRFARLGKALRPTEEPVRMAQEASLGFAPSTLASCEQQPKGLPPRLEQRFFGLLGPNGPLPLHLTEHAITRQIHHQDKTFGRFLDVLQHRMLLLFYRAWADAQPTVRADRPAEDRFAFYLGAVAGWSTPHMRGRDAVPDVAKIFFAGHFVRPQRNAEALAAMLSEFFGLPVKVDQFVPTWLERQRVTRSLCTMKTVSTVPPAGRAIRYLIVPSAAEAWASMRGVEIVWEAAMRSRSGRGRSVQPAGSVTPRA